MTDGECGRSNDRRPNTTGKEKGRGEVISGLATRTRWYDFLREVERRGPIVVIARVGIGSEFRPPREGLVISRCVLVLCPSSRYISRWLRWSDQRKIRLEADQIQH